jgi:Domain of unknown function (DUF1906)
LITFGIPFHSCYWHNNPELLLCGKDGSGVFLNMNLGRRVFLAIALLWSLVGAALSAPNCTTQRGMSAVDLSQPVTTITTKNGKTGVEALKSIGIKTVARYYAWVGPDTTCKSMFPSESDALIAAGFNIITIFQYESSDPEMFFKPNRGAKDAQEALHMAGANGQPAGSAIYFAVDGVDQVIKDSVFEHSLHRGKSAPAARRKRLVRADPSYRKHFRFYERFRHYHRNVFKKAAPNIHPADMLPFVDRYFREVQRVMKTDGRYRIGAYGSGMVCKHLLASKLVDFCWLAMSSGWPGSREFQASGKWSMVQQRTTFCRGWKFKEQEMARFDFNRVKSGDIGQWNKKGPITPAAGLPPMCKPSW